MRFASSERAARCVDSRGHRELRFFALLVFEIYRIAYLCDFFAGVRSDLLASKDDSFALAQPNVTHNSTVVPPVIPNVLRGLQLHRQAGDSRQGGPVIQFDCDQVLAWPYQFRDVKEIFGVAAVVASGRNSIDPDSRMVKCRTKMQLQLLDWAPRWQFEGAKIPRNSFIVVVLADIPGVRNRHLLGAFRHRFAPPRLFALGFRVNPEQPGTIQIDFGTCRR